MADSLPPRVEDQTTQEFTDERGVTTPVRTVRDVVPPDADGVDLVWHGEKADNARRFLTNVHQGDATSINVPPSPEEDPDYIEFHPAGVEERPLHSQGQTYNFRRHQATRVKAEHVEWLMHHPVLKFERLESVAERARVEIEAEKRRIRAEEERQQGKHDAAGREDEKADTLAKQAEESIPKNPPPSDGGSALKPKK